MVSKSRMNMVTGMLSIAALAIIGTSCASSGVAVPEVKTNPKKLKVVLLMGQSNMVGYSRPMTAWYLTQPMYVPPAKLATYKPRYFDWGFYWSGVRYAYGDSEEYNARGKALLDERHELRRLWRSRVYNDKTGYKNDWKEWKDEWGPVPGSELGIRWRADMQRFLNEKAEEEGLYKRIAEYIESPENKFPPKVALEQMAKRDEPIADDIKRVRKLFLKGTKPEDFDGLTEAIQSFGDVTPSNRLAYAELVRGKVHLPIARHTYISAFGEVAGSPANGRLSLGYTKWPTACGPEYPFGISFEQMVDGPVLLIKCAWGGTSLDVNWRPPSLATKEKPTGPLFKASLDHIRTVLSDPGKIVPDYDPKAGYEIAGLVWFQGWNDLNNEEYGEQLVHFIKDWRKELNAPEMPVVCGLLGHAAWKQNTFDGNVNSGMLYAAKQPGLKGTVDIVNTLPYMPIELGVLGQVRSTCGADSKEYKEAERVIKRATCKDGTHYFGSAKFIYLTGDAMARKLANLMAGGEPTIFKEAAEILGGK